MPSIKPERAKLIVYALCAALSLIGLASSLEAQATTPNTCESRTCHWIGGAGSFSDITHWSDSFQPSATCNCLPRSGDRVVFDSSSGSGVVTQDIASLVTGPLNMTGTSIVIHIPNGTTWTIVAPYRPANPDSFGPALAQAINAFWVILFLVFCAIVVIGAWKIRSHL